MISPGLRVVWDERLALQVLAHARRDGRYDLAGMFLDLPPMDERLEPPPPPLPRAMAKVPLGVRRSLARRNDIGLIERLLGDPDPAVVENLLNNPRITELEVVRMAARSPVREEVLAAIARHPRWGIRHRVRVTLAHNPGTPTGDHARAAAPAARPGAGGGSRRTGGSRSVVTSRAAGPARRPPIRGQLAGVA